MTTPMLLPANSLTVIRGTSKTLQLTVTKPDGTYYDLTGARLVLTVKEGLSDDLPTIQKRSNVPAEGAITVPRQGIAEFYLKPVDTQGLKPCCSLVFDVWLITASGDRYCVVAPSTFVVQPGVTYLPL
jgi:hypothetical protein